MRLRTVKLRAGGSAPLWLVDVRAYPELPATFAMVDDSGVCRSATAELGHADAAIQLKPGEEYSVTILLDTTDGPQRRHVHHLATCHQLQRRQTPCLCLFLAR